MSQKVAIEVPYVYNATVVKARCRKHVDILFRDEAPMLLEAVPSEQRHEAFRYQNSKVKHEIILSTFDGKDGVYKALLEPDLKTPLSPGRLEYLLSKKCVTWCDNPFPFAAAAHMVNRSGTDIIDIRTHQYRHEVPIKEWRWDDRLARVANLQWWLDLVILCDGVLYRRDLEPVWLVKLTSPGEAKISATTCPAGEDPFFTFKADALDEAIDFVKERLKSRFNIDGALKVSSAMAVRRNDRQMAAYHVLKVFLSDIECNPLQELPTHILRLYCALRECKESVLGSGWSEEICEQIIRNALTLSKVLQQNVGSPTCIKKSVLQRFSLRWELEEVDPFRGLSISFD
ncbi:hypothetical protein [Thalassospira xiamenensis]|uniref:Uncharacterized protein n=1 Tax=Thalassospira xiamenensis TaxID=220697 RepID=A0A285TTR6_9PROT|nr:hypothetical protein [Thalassospira xiamenensis]SOC27457.1 hypothetical protein SAMN05428964_105427 [Thalassospira xiamenensis]